MKHFTLQQFTKLAENLPPLTGDVRPPKPFPGRRFPTRVAWVILMDRAKPSKDRRFKPPEDLHLLEYLGKPNQLRALSASAFARQGRLKKWFAVEFDKLGPVAWFYGENFVGTIRQNSARYYAYHPQGSIPDPIVAFGKPVYVKRIGGLSTYSYQKRLNQDQIEKFYEWYEKSFKKKLRRPKQTPMSLESEVEL